MRGSRFPVLILLLCVLLLVALLVSWPSQTEISGEPPIGVITGDYYFAAARGETALRPDAHLRAQRVERHCRATKLDLRRPANHKPRHGTLFGNWWQDNYEPTWSCPLEERVQLRDSDQFIDSKSHVAGYSVADGGKWVCDPSVLLRGPDCLIYSFGSNGEFSFELGLDEMMGPQKCEFHIFDPFDVEPKFESVKNLLKQSPNIRIHTLGLASFDHVTPPLKRWSNREVTMKSLQSIVRSLNHTGRLIDVLKIDCEGCEYGMLDSSTWWQDVDSSGVRVGQLLLEAHFNPVSNKTYRFRDENNAWVAAKKGEDVDVLFRTLHHQGFVTFHKEINLIGKPPNDAAEFAMLRLNINCTA